MSATQTAAKVSRESLEDRYNGLMLAGLNPSKLQEKLDGVTWGIVDGLSRLPYRTMEESTERGVDRLIDEVQALIREHVIRRVDELGLAR